ncbi:MAG TPA: proton-conducting transporter membrane subunit, partial [Acidobacteriaceae bacterium]|nr:proton-conducting transporter membrane subunit [Acidobacteriaceae bacterium]
LAFSVQGPLAIAAKFTYLLAHAFVKSGLFFTSGILLHRLRSISEREIFRRGRGMHWIAGLWFLGGAGLAGAPPFSTMLGEAGVSAAADLAGLRGFSLLYLFAGAITGAAVFRVGMHTFLGWGDEPVTDRAADVGELPETKAEDRRVFWYQSTPAAVCIIVAAVVSFLPGWLPALRDSSAGLASQAAYLHTVYSGQSVRLVQSSWQDAIPGAALRGCIGLMLAIALACTSVFRSRLRRVFRLGAFLEGRLGAVRAMQSGHPGDYVLWITIGLAVFGSATMFLLR